MNLEELGQREDALGVLANTLQQGWGEQRGAQVDVVPGRGQGQQWYAMPLLGGCFVDDAGPDVQRFLREGLQYTPRLSRLLPQWAGTQVLTSGIALRALCKPAFAVTPALDDARHLVVLPGNRRVRVLDLAARTCRVMLKQDYAADTMQRDIAIRGDGQRGPFVPISHHADDGTWFDEPLWDGYALPRIPPWWSRSRVLGQVKVLLERWLDDHATVVDAAPYLDALATRLRERWTRLIGRHPALRRRDLPAWVDKLHQAALVEPRLCLSQSHGDLQPGNILVDRHARHVTLIDWEHSGLRSYHYDHLVLGLPSRPQRDLGRDAKRFVDGSHASPLLAGLPRDRGWRKRALALFLLEDLEWFVDEAAQVGGARVPAGLARLLQALPRLSTVFGHD